MKKTLLCAAVVAALFSACKKDDEKASSYVTINGKTYTTNQGFVDVESGWYLFTNINYNTADLTKLTSGVTGVNLGLDTLIDGNTYTLYNWRDTVTFDKTKHLQYASISENFKYDAALQDFTGKSYEEFSSGSCTVKKSGNTYTFNYELKAGDSVTVKGVYTGGLTTAADRDL